VSVLSQCMTGLHACCRVTCCRVTCCRPWQCKSCEPLLLLLKPAVATHSIFMCVKVEANLEVVAGESFVTRQLHEPANAAQAVQGLASAVTCSSRGLFA
jgi:hypothetical protein